MNTPDTSKATARPWRVANGGVLIFRQQNNGGRKSYIADVSQDAGRDASIANAALIVRAVNEYDALNAVAKAAQRLINNPECECYPPDDLKVCKYCSAWEATDSALSQLAAIRKGETK